MNTPRVSVVIPCRNLGVYLDEAIQSLLAQTVQDFEILVVDDGSDDEATTAVFARAAWPKTTVHRTLHQGLARARNFLIDRARGEFICALDADDRLHPQFLERTLGAFDRDPSLTFVSTRLRMFGDEERVWPDRADCGIGALLVDDTVITAALVRRAAVQAVGGYDEGMPAQGDEDWDLWISLVENGGKGTILPDVLFFYRRRRGSMCDQCTAGQTHLDLIAYIARKHVGQYRAHAAEVLLAKDRTLDRLARDRERLQDHVRFLEGSISQRRAPDARPQSPASAADDTAELRAEYERSRAEVAALRSSWSWRITSPLRRAYDWLSPRPKRGHR